MTRGFRQISSSKNTAAVGHWCGRKVPIQSGLVGYRGTATS